MRPEDLPAQFSPAGVINFALVWFCTLIPWFLISYAVIYYGTATPKEKRWKYALIASAIISAVGAGLMQFR